MKKWTLTADGTAVAFDVPLIRSNDDGARHEAERRVVAAALGALRSGAHDVQILDGSGRLFAEDVSGRLVRVRDGAVFR